MLKSYFDEFAQFNIIRNTTKCTRKQNIENVNMHSFKCTAPKKYHCH